MCLLVSKLIIGYKVMVDKISEQKKRERERIQIQLIRQFFIHLVFHSPFILI
jgi:predicted glycosyltransferase